MFRALALRRSRLCGILPLLTVEVNLLRCVHTSDVNADARAVKTSVNATWRRRKEKENFPFLAHTLRLHSLLLQKFPSVNGGDANTDASLPPPTPPKDRNKRAWGTSLFASLALLLERPCACIYACVCVYVYENKLLSTLPHTPEIA